MENVNPRSLNIGLLAGIVGLAVVACGAEDPQPRNVGGTQPITGAPAGSGGTTAATPGITPVTPGGAGTIAAAAPPPQQTQQPVAAPSSPAQPAAQPSASPVPMPVATGAAPAQPAAAPAETPAAAEPAAAEPAAEEPAPAAGGEGNVLTPAGSDLWVAAESNGVGVKGSWYGYQDEFTTDCCEDMLTLEDDAVCMSGSTAAGEEGNYDIWGAGMGFNFNDSDPWDGSAYSGVSFTATVDSAADVKVIMKMGTTAVEAGGEHFVALKSGANTISWTSVAQPDWAETVAFDPSDIEAMQVQVGTGDGAANPFTVCISALTVLD